MVQSRRIDIEGVIMEIVEGPFGLRFIKIDSTEIFLGTDKGAWVYASERPRRVNLPSFMIMETPITETQYAEILGKNSDTNELKDMITNDDVDLICSALSNHFDDDVRRPTQSEWKAAEAYIKLPCGWTELLADEATGNTQRCDLGWATKSGRNDWAYVGAQGVSIRSPYSRRSVCPSCNSRR